MVETTGHLIVVLGESNGIAVDRSCTSRIAPKLGDEVCHTTTTAVTSAHNTANSRNLVAMPPLRSAALRGV